MADRIEDIRRVVASRPEPLGDDYEALLARIDQLTTERDTRTPVTGPHRISVDRIPGGVTLDVSDYLTHVVLALVDEESGALYDITEQADLAAGYRANGHDDSYALHRRDALIEDLIERLSPHLPVYGDGVARLVERLTNAAPKRATGGAAA